MKINYIENIETIEKDFDFTFENKTEYYLLKYGTYPHTDNTEYLEISSIEGVKKQLRELFDKQGFVCVDVYHMNEQEYNNTLLANCGEVFTDIYNKNDIITVFIFR